MNQQSDPDSTPISGIVDAELRHDSGTYLGVIDELLVDLPSGRIVYLLATGAHGQRLRFPWSSVTVERGNFVLRGTGPRLVIDRDRPWLRRPQRDR